MSKMLIPCLATVLATIAFDAHASRCADSVAQFAQHIDVTIGAPIPEKVAKPENEDDPLPGKSDSGVAVPAANSAPIQPPATMAGPVAVQAAGTPRIPSDHKYNGKELKANAKAVLSSLLNAALAAGEEGRSGSCFRQLNSARAVVLDKGSVPSKTVESDWR